MNNIDTTKTAQGGETRENAQGTKALYESELERFRRAMSESREGAFQRYGFALFHSLSQEEQYLTKEELGIKCEDAIDCYNLGVAHAMREEFEKAIDCWNKALKQDSSLADAHFNIAVASERLNNMNAARSHYKQYIESIDDAEEIEQVKQHLAEIGG